MQSEMWVLNGPFTVNHLSFASAIALYAVAASTDVAAERAAATTSMGVIAVLAMVFRSLLCVLDFDRCLGLL